MRCDSLLGLLLSELWLIWKCGPREKDMIAVRTGHCDIANLGKRASVSPILNDLVGYVQLKLWLWPTEGYRRKPLIVALGLV